MIALILFIIIFLMGLFTFKRTNICVKKSIGKTLMCTASVILVLTLFWTLNEYAKLKPEKEKLKLEYEFLTYKINNSILNNPDALHNDRDLLNDIEKWNCKVVYGKNYQSNILTGFFIPNIYSDINEIKLERYDVGG